MKHSFINNWNTFFQNNNFNLTNLIEIYMKCTVNPYNNPTDLLKPFTFFNPSDIKGVIVGQSPYPSKEYVTGLAFEIPLHTNKQPPTFKNILKKFNSEMNLMSNPAKIIDLSEWASEGVLLINVSLTIPPYQSKQEAFLYAHWMKLLNYFFQKIQPHFVIAWGKKAQEFVYNDLNFSSKKTTIIEGIHPSPLSSHRGFFKKNYFITANEILKNKSIREIDWKKAIR